MLTVAHAREHLYVHMPLLLAVCALDFSLISIRLMQADHAVQLLPAEKTRADDVA